MADILWWQGPCECTICSHRCQLVAPVKSGENEPAMPTECPHCGNISLEIREKANAPLTEEWIKSVGLFHPGKTGSVLCGSVASDSKLQLRKQTTEGRWLVLFQGPDQWQWLGILTDNLKTIGDVRQLCRLLGVPIKE